MTTGTITLVKEMAWALFSKSSELQRISIEDGDLSYWRLGVDLESLGHSMEIGDFVSFSDEPYIKTVGETIISVTSDDFQYTFNNYLGNTITGIFEVKKYQRIVYIGEIILDGEILLNGEIACA